MPRSIAVFIGVLSVATGAHAGSQLFEGSWVVEAFGNPRLSRRLPYLAYRFPMGFQCNPSQPRCPFQSTPTDGSGNFAPRGSGLQFGLWCAPWYDWGGGGAVARPAKGYTLTTGGPLKRLIPPLYRHPGHFLWDGEPDGFSCTSGTAGPPPFWMRDGQPLTGIAYAITTGAGMAGFSVPAAGISDGGIRGVRVGDWPVRYPYIYSYSYASLRNANGVFGPGQGPGSFSVKHVQGKSTVARIVVRRGAAKFGGTMKMLGLLTSKHCYYRNGGCSLGSTNWRYDAIGAAAYTDGGVVTMGYRAVETRTYVNCPLVQCTGAGTPCCPHAPLLEGSRFPWTTGSVTVTAIDQGTFGYGSALYAQGFDNRTPTHGKGTVQLVSPTLTRWLEPGVNLHTGGIGILRLKFLPEPRAWGALVAGVALLAVAWRCRG